MPEEQKPIKIEVVRRKEIKIAEVEEEETVDVSINTPGHANLYALTEEAEEAIPCTIPLLRGESHRISIATTRKVLFIVEIEIHDDESVECVSLNDMSIWCDKTDAPGVRITNKAITIYIGPLEVTKKNVLDALAAKGTIPVDLVPLNIPAAGGWHKTGPDELEYYKLWGSSQFTMQIFTDENNPPVGTDKIAWSWPGKECFAASATCTAYPPVGTFIQNAIEELHIRATQKATTEIKKIEIAYSKRKYLIPKAYINTPCSIGTQLRSYNISTGDWSGLEGKGVKLMMNDVLVETKKTDFRGNVSFSFTPSAGDMGSVTFEMIFDGDDTSIPASYREAFFVLPALKVISCNSRTNGFATGCELLRSYDTMAEGVISSAEMDNAYNDYYRGNRSIEEFFFILSAFGKNINDVCPGCTVEPEVPIGIPEELTLRVTRVIDGDTVEAVRTDTNEVLQVRLVGINTPEKNSGTIICSLSSIGSVPPIFADHSTAKLEELVLSNEVIARIDVNQPTDHYGRLLAVLFDGGTNVCTSMIASGLACFWDYGAGNARTEEYRAQFIAAERDAYINKKGIWSVEPSEVITGKPAILILHEPTSGVSGMGIFEEEGVNIFTASSHEIEAASMKHSMKTLWDGCDCHHWPDRTYSIGAGLFCDDKKLCKMELGVHELRLQKNKYRDWVLNQNWESGKTYEYTPEMMPGVSGGEEGEEAPAILILHEPTSGVSGMGIFEEEGVNIFTASSHEIEAASMKHSMKTLWDGCDCHHWPDRTYSIGAGLFCDDKKLCKMELGVHELRLQKNKYRDWVLNQNWESGKTYEYTPEMMPGVSGGEEGEEAPAILILHEPTSGVSGMGIFEEEGVNIFTASSHEIEAASMKHSMKTLWDGCDCHHWPDRTYSIGAGLFCDDKKLCKMELGVHELRLQKNKYRDWVLNQNWESGKTYEYTPEMMPGEGGGVPGEGEVKAGTGRIHFFKATDGDSGEELIFAKIYVDGCNTVEMTPTDIVFCSDCEVYNCPVKLGTRTIDVKKPGYNVWRKIVTIKKDDVINLQPILYKGGTEIGGAVYEKASAIPEEIYLGVPATFNMNVKNTGDVTLKYRLYMALVGVDVENQYPFPEREPPWSVDIRPGEEVMIPVLVTVPFDAIPADKDEATYDIQTHLEAKTI